MAISYILYLEWCIRRGPPDDAIIISSREPQEQLQQLRIDGCSESCDRVPTIHRREPRTAAVRVAPVLDVRQDAAGGMLIQYGVQEPDRTLADGLPLRIQQRNDCGPPRRRQARPEEVEVLSTGEHAEVSPVGADIRIAPAGAVVDASMLADVGGVCVGHVGWMARVVARKVRLHGRGLVGGSGEIVAEAAARGEEGGGAARRERRLHRALGVLDGLVRLQLGGADRRDVGTVAGVVRVVDGLVLAGSRQAAALGYVAGEASHAEIAG